VTFRLLAPENSHKPARKLFDAVMATWAIAQIHIAQQPKMPPDLKSPPPAPTQPFNKSARPVELFSVDVFNDTLAAPLQQTMADVGFRAIASSEQFVHTIDRLINESDGRPIRQLNLYGHGVSGTQYVGKASQLDANLLKQPEVRAAFARLRDRLAPQAQITLYGCLVGRGETGSDLLLELSRLTGARIEAGVSTQIPEPGELDGLVKMAIPDAQGVPHIAYRQSNNALGNFALSTLLEGKPDETRELRAGDGRLVVNVDLLRTSEQHRDRLLQFLEKPVDSQSKHIDKMLQYGVDLRDLDAVLLSLLSRSGGDSKGERMFAAARQILSDVHPSHVALWYNRHFAESFSDELPRSWPFDKLTEAQRGEVKTLLSRRVSPSA
jgi:hypothetical protein